MQSESNSLQHSGGGGGMIIKRFSWNPFHKKHADDTSNAPLLPQSESTVVPLVSLKLTLSDGDSGGTVLNDGSRSPTSTTTATTATTTIDESHTIPLVNAHTVNSDSIKPAVLDPSHSLSSSEIVLTGATARATKQRRPQSGSVSGTGNVNNVPYGNAYMRPLNPNVFSEWKVPFCFLCGGDFGASYSYTAVIHNTGYMYGCHEIKGVVVCDPVIYRQLYVCDECNERVICANPPVGRIKLHPDAYTLFL